MMLKKRNDSFFAISPVLFFGISLPIILLGLVADRVMKLLATARFIEGETYELIPGILRLTYATNRGAAFSILEDQMLFFILLTVIVLVFAFYILIRGHVYGLFGVISLSVCISGAIGNFIDRLLYGFVVDMFEPIFVEFAIFNVADVLLNIGGVAFAVYFLFMHEKHREKHNSPVDIKTSEFRYMSVTQCEVISLGLKDGKTELEITRFDNCSEKILDSE